MRQLKIFCLALVLAVTACRSVPTYARTAHDLSMMESELAMVLLDDTINKIESKSSELNNKSVNDAYDAWKIHYTKVIELRSIVSEFLREDPKDLETAKAYIVGTRIIGDLTGGFREIDMYWNKMVDPAFDLPAKEFVKAVRRDIERFRVLERKFDEWIRQFPVKD